MFDTMELSLEHIHPELIDIPCFVEYKTYIGKTSGANSDDPDEVDILSIQVLHDQFSEKGEKILSQGQFLKIDRKLSSQIERHV